MKIYGRSKDAPDILLNLEEVIRGRFESAKVSRPVFLGAGRSSGIGLGRDHERYLDNEGAMEGGVEVVVADPAAFVK